MATTYDYIAVNKRRSIILVVVFVLVIGLLGWTVGEMQSAGYVGVAVAGVIAVIMALTGYYGGAKIALMTADAQGPINKDDNPYLFRLVENLVITVGMPMPKIYLIAAAQINAFATGRDPRHASIAVTTGAIEQLENEELEGVLAHELSHIKNYDIRFLTLVTIMVGMVAILSDLWWRGRWFGGRRGSGHGGQIQAVLMLLGLVLLILAPLISQLIKFAVSRQREFLADAAGALITRYPEGLARALEKIERSSASPLERNSGAIAHLFISNPFGQKTSGLAKMFSTHPPIAERVQALRRMGGIATSG